ncbi:MAG: cellulose synthase family protein, partial [Bryobacteraceae bacterium]
MVATLLPLALLASTSATSRMVRSLFDDSFSGIYQLSWFDWSILIPYFAILALLSVYGVHRYEMIRTYFKHRKKAVGEPRQRFAQLPPVTIQLPIFNERYVVERLIDEVARIEYPRELLQIQVLDDSTDDTAPFAEALVERYQALGLPIEYHHRANREGFKAGALQAGLKTATGEFVAIFDADFVPPTDFLTRTIHHFTDPIIGVVQTRWSYLNRDYSFLTEVEAMLLDGHFILEHGARSRAGYFFNFNGTAGILRRTMIDDAGGWQHDTLTEDSDLSYRAQLKGWKFVYMPGLECPSELPVEMHGFQVQQSRWAKGLTQCARKLLPRIFRSKAPLRLKVEAFMHLTPNISYPLMVVVSALMLPVMIVRFYMGVWQMVFIDLPLIMAAFWSISAFYVVAQRELYPKNWKRSILLLPMLMATGVALTVINTRAVLEALFGVTTGFVRTPKFAVGDRHMNLEHKKYRAKSGLLPYIEIAIGTY